MIVGNKEREKESPQFYEWLNFSVFIYKYLSIHKLKELVSVTNAKWQRSVRGLSETVTFLQKYMFVAGVSSGQRGRLSEYQLLIPRTDADSDNARCQPYLNRTSDLEFDSEIKLFQQCAFAPKEGGLLAVATSKRQILFYSVLRLRQGLMFKLPKHSQDLSALKNDPKRGFLSADQEGIIYIWDLKRITQQPVLKMKNHQSSVLDLAWLPEASHASFASASSDSNIILWDVRDKNPAQKIKAHTGTVNSICCLSKDFIASGGSEGIIKFWDFRTTKQYAYKEHQSQVKKLIFLQTSEDNPQNKIMFASGARNGRVTIWNQKADFSHLGHQSAVSGLDYVQNDCLYLSCEEQRNTVMVWRPALDTREIDRLV